MINQILVSCVIESGIGYIEFNRPPANAYNLSFHQHFSNAIDQVEQDKSVRVVVIKSLSEKFFCAGADIKEFLVNTPQKNQEMVDLARSNLDRIEQSNKVYIAQISGHTMGGGLEIALACDLRFAAEGNYLIGMSEIKLGLIPGNGGIVRFAKLVGKTKALEYLLTGQNFSPDVAHRIGLFSTLVVKEQLEQEVLNFAQHLAIGPALAISSTKQLISQILDLPIEQGHQLERLQADQLAQTMDGKEGLKAFVEKREPVFCGA